jgi:hypothetical protein
MTRLLPCPKQIPLCTVLVRGCPASTPLKQLRREAQDLKEVVAEQALELRLLKKA